MHRMLYIDVWKIGQGISYTLSVYGGYNLGRRYGCTILVFTTRMLNLFVQGQCKFSHIFVKANMIVQLESKEGGLFLFR
jgi:hypothetical protein